MVKRKTTAFEGDNIFFLLAILLILLSLAYFAEGYYDLIVTPVAKDGANDLFERWQEQQYIYQGKYPYDAVEGSSLVDPKIGPIKSGGYLPWSFFTGFIFFPKISWELTRWYWAFPNLISLIILALFSYQIGATYGKSKALFMMGASLAIGTHATTLSLGQYGIVINALLILTYWLLEKHKNVLAGILLGMAMVKPNISGAYLFILIIQRKIKAIWAFFIYIILASISIWIITKVNPIYMINRINEQSKYFAKKGDSAVNILINSGIDNQVATVILALVSLTVILIIFYLWRNNELLTLFATSAAIMRIGTYHRIYDDVMLIFLLLASLKLTFDRPKKFNILISALLGLSLWIPPRATSIPLVTEIQLFIWTVSLVNLLIQRLLHSSLVVKKTNFDGL